MNNSSKVSHSVSGAVRTFAYFMTIGTHYKLEGVDYLKLYGSDPSAIESAFTIFVNNLKVDSKGNVVNTKYTDSRAAGYIRQYIDPTYEMNPPLEFWEVVLY